MKFIKIIHDIQICDPNTGMPVQGIPKMSHSKYVDSWPLNDKRFGSESGFGGIMAGSRIQLAFREAAIGEIIALDEADYKILKQSIMDPQLVTGGQATPEVVRQYLPFMESIVNAKEKRPNKSEREEAKEAERKTSIDEDPEIN